MKRQPRPINRVPNVLGVDLTSAAKAGRLYNPREYSLAYRVQFRSGEEFSSFTVAFTATVASTATVTSTTTIASAAAAIRRGLRNDDQARGFLRQPPVV